MDYRELLHSIIQRSKPKLINIDNGLIQGLYNTEEDVEDKERQVDERLRLISEANKRIAEGDPSASGNLDLYNDVNKLAGHFIIPQVSGDDLTATKRIAEPQEKSKGKTRDQLADELLSKVIEENKRIAERHNKQQEEITSEGVISPQDKTKPERVKEMLLEEVFKKKPKGKSEEQLADELLKRVMKHNKRIAERHKKQKEAKTEETETQNDNSSKEDNLPKTDEPTIQGGKEKFEMLSPLSDIMSISQQQQLSDGTVVKKQGNKLISITDKHTNEIREQRKKPLDRHALLTSIQQSLGEEQLAKIEKDSYDTVLNEIILKPPTVDQLLSDVSYNDDGVLVHVLKKPPEKKRFSGKEVEKIYKDYVNKRTQALVTYTINKRTKEIEAQVEELKQLSSKYDELSNNINLSNQKEVDNINNLAKDINSKIAKLRIEVPIHEETLRLYNKNIIEPNIKKRLIDENQALGLVSEIVSGAYGAYEGMFGAVDWITDSIGLTDKKSGSSKVVQAMAFMRDKFTPKKRNFANQLFNAVGSMAAFYQLGMPVQAFSKSKKAYNIATWVMTGAEALTEAGAVYNEKRDFSAAAKSFFVNVILIAITNRFGIRDPKKVSALKNFLVSQQLEGIQEFGQTIIEKWAKGEEIDTKAIMEALESYGVGSIVGGYASLFETASQKQKTNKFDPVFTEGKHPDIELKPPSETPTTDNKGGTPLTPEMKEIENNLQTFGLGYYAVIAHKLNNNEKLTDTEQIAYELNTFTVEQLRKDMETDPKKNDSISNFRNSRVVAEAISIVQNAKREGERVNIDRLVELAKLYPEERHDEANKLITEALEYNKKFDNTIHLITPKEYKPTKKATLDIDTGELYYETRDGKKVKTTLSEAVYDWFNLPPDLQEMIQKFSRDDKDRFNRLISIKPKTEEKTPPEQKPEGKPEDKPEQKPEGKPEDKPEQKPEGKPEDKPEQKPEIKPEVKQPVSQETEVKPEEQETPDVTQQKKTTTQKTSQEQGGMQDAIQKPSTDEILQRQQEETKETGSERGRMESEVKRQETPQETKQERDKGKSEEETELKLEGQQTRKQLVAPEEEAEVSNDVKVMPLSEINVDENRFQNRLGRDGKVLKVSDMINNENIAGVSYSQVDDMAKNWNAREQDPIHVWRDPKDGKLYVISGHHRYAAALKSGQKQIKVIDRSNDFTEEQAIKYGKGEANVNRLQETEVERARYYRGLREQGVPEKEIRKQISKHKREQKRIYRLTFLNPDGATMHTLASASNSDTIKLTDIIGGIRQRHPQLTDMHEDELFKYLFLENRLHSIDQYSFNQYIDDIVNSASFSFDKPLGLLYRSPKTNKEIELEKELRELEKEKRSIEKKRNDLARNRLDLPFGVTYQEAMKNYDNKISEINEQILEISEKLSKQRNSETKRNQIDLFESLIEEVKDGKTDEIVRGTNPEELEKLAENIERKAENIERKAKSSEETTLNQAVEEANELVEPKEAKPAEKTKKEKIDEEIDNAIDDFLKEFNKPTDFLASSLIPINPELISKGSKIIALYTKKGIYKFSDIVRELSKQIGRISEELFEALKLAYTNYVKTRPIEMVEELDKDISKVKYSDIFKGGENEQRVYSRDTQEHADRPQEGLVATGRTEGRTDMDGGGRRIVFADAERIPQFEETVPQEKYTIDENQRFAVNLILDTFFNRGEKAFLLADGTGVGKTRELLVSAREYIDRTGEQVLIVTQDNKVIDGFKKEAKSAGVKLDNIEILTYDNIRTNKAKRSEYGLVIFDEAHNLRNQTAQKTIKAKSIGAKHKIYATATPMDKIDGAIYFIGELTNLSREEIIRQLGLREETRTNPITGQPFVVLAYDQDSNYNSVIRRLLEIRSDLISEGKMLRREYPFLGTIQILELAFNLDKLKLEEKIYEHYKNKIAGVLRSRSYSEHIKQKIVKGLALKRHAEIQALNEVSKVVLAVRNIIEDVRSGKSVVVFAERVSQSVLKSFNGTIPGTIEEIVDRLEKENISVSKIYGNNQQEKLEETNKFQNGQTQVAVGTPESMSTGINLDDQVGNRPRSVYILTYNYSAIVNEQMLGRVSRKNTKSLSEAYYIIDPHSIAESKRLETVKNKIRALASIQRGKIIEGVDIVEDVVETQTELSIADNYKEIEKLGLQDIYELFAPTGVEVVADPKIIGKKLESLVDSDNNVYGFTDGEKIYLLARGLNTNTPIHEYTHIWFRALEKLNPNLFKHAMSLLQKTKEWDNVKKDKNYAHIKNDKRAIASEVLSRLSGNKAQEILAKEKVNLRDKLVDFVSQFWTWVKDTFTNWSKEEASKVTIDDLITMPLKDLAKGVNLKQLQERKSYKEGRKQKAINRIGDILYKIVKDVFGVDLNSRPYYEYSYTPPIQENIHKLYQRAFSDVSKLIRQKSGAAYDYGKEYIDYIRKVIPIKSSVKQVFEDYGHEIAQQFLREKLRENTKEWGEVELDKLLKQTNYEFIETKTEEEVYSFAGEYRDDEIICTISRMLAGDRLQDSYIFWLRRRNAGNIPPADLLNQNNITPEWAEYLEKIGRKNPDGTYNLEGLKRERDDPYGTSSICVQVAKDGSKILMISRYNHKAPGNPDAVYGGDLNKVIGGLEKAILDYYNIDRESIGKRLTKHNIIRDKEGRYFVYSKIVDGAYYGDNFVLYSDGTAQIFSRDKIRNAGAVIFDAEQKTIQFPPSQLVRYKLDKISISKDTIEFKHNGDNYKIKVKEGQITEIESDTADSELLSKIIIHSKGFSSNNILERVWLPNVREIIVGRYFCNHCKSLKELHMPNLQTMPYESFNYTALKEINLPNLKGEVENCFNNNNVELEVLNIPNVTILSNSIQYNQKLKSITFNNIEIVRNSIIGNTDLKEINISFSGFISNSILHSKNLEKVNIKGNSHTSSLTHSVSFITAREINVEGVRNINNSLNDCDANSISLPDALHITQSLNDIKVNGVISLPKLLNSELSLNLAYANTIDAPNLIYTEGWDNPIAEKIIAPKATLQSIHRTVKEIDVYGFDNRFIRFIEDGRIMVNYLEKAKLRDNKSIQALAKSETTNSNLVIYDKNGEVVFDKKNPNLRSAQRLYQKNDKQKLEELKDLRDHLNAVLPYLKDPIKIEETKKELVELEKKIKKLKEKIDKPNLFDATKQNQMSLFQKTSKAQAYYDVNPEKLPLTLKVFDNPSFKNLRNKIVSVNTIKQLLKQSGIKKIEIELIEGIIQEHFPQAEKIDYNLLEYAVRISLLPLERIETNAYSDNNNAATKLRPTSSTTIILNSPVMHGVRGHFTSEYSGHSPKYAPVQIKGNLWGAVNEKHKNLKGDELAKHLVMSGTKEDVDKWIYKQETSYSRPSGLFGHFRVWWIKGEMHIVEIQSDYFQQANLSELVFNIVYEKNIHSNKDITKFLEARKGYKDAKTELEGLIMSFEENYGNEWLSMITEQEVSHYLETTRKVKMAEERFAIEAKPYMENLTLNEKQLIAYSKVWEKRIIQEIIKYAINNGAKKVKFADAETLALIEGFGDPYVQPYKTESSYIEKLEAGDRIIHLDEPYIVIKADDITITVAKEENVHFYRIDDYVAETAQMRLEDIQYDLDRQVEDIDNITKEEYEQLDYDKIPNGDIVREVLKEKFDQQYYYVSFNYNIASDIIERLEKEIRKEIDEYREEYFINNYGYNAAGIDSRGMVYHVVDSASYDFMQPDQYDTVPEGYIDAVREGYKSILERYDKIPETIKKEYKDAQVAHVRDKHGYGWYEVTITKEMEESPMSLFQTAHNNFGTVYDEMSIEEKEIFLEELARMVSDEWTVEFGEIEDANGVTYLLDKIIRLDPSKADFTTLWEEAFHQSMVALAKEEVARKMLMDAGWDGKGEIWDVAGNESLREAHEKLAEEFIEWIIKKKAKPTNAKEMIFKKLRQFWGAIARVLFRYGFVTHSGYFEALYSGDMKVMTQERLQKALRSAERPRLVQEEDDDKLIGVHNISEFNLNRAMRHGALVSPSIGIVKVKHGHEGFGEISLIAPRELLDYTHTYIYDGDIYSAIYPRVYYSINESKYIQKIKEIADALGEELFAAYEYGIMQIENIKTGLESLFNNPSVRVYYLAKTNQLPERIIRNKPLKLLPTSERSSEIAKKLFEKYPELKEGMPVDEKYIKTKYRILEEQGAYKSIKDKSRRSVILMQVAAESERTMQFEKLGRIAKLFAEEYIDMAIDNVHSRRLHKLRIENELLIEDIRTLLNPTKELYFYEYQELVDSMIIEQMNRFETFIEEEFTPIVKDEYILVGNEKIPHTPENVLKYISQGFVAGEKILSMNLDYATAKNRNQITTKGAKKIKDRLVSPEMFQVVKSAIERKFYEIADIIEALLGETLDYTETLNLSKAIGELALFSPVKRQQITKVLKQNDIDISKAQISDDHILYDKIQSLVRALKKNPTPYFEAKVKDVVKLDRFIGALVPDDTSPSTVEKLIASGIKEIKYYEKDNYEDRREKLGEFKQALFQRTTPKITRDSRGKEVPKKFEKQYKFAQRHPLLEGWEIVIQDPEIEYWTKDEILAADYSEAFIETLYKLKKGDPNYDPNVEKYEVKIAEVTEYNPDESVKRITISSDATESAFAEGITHAIYKELERSNPELLSRINTWTNYVKLEAEKEGISLPSGEELFVQSYVFHRLGFAEERPDLANIFEIPNDILRDFEGVLNSGEALSEAIYNAEDRIIDNDMQAEAVGSIIYNDMLRNGEEVSYSKWLKKFKNYQIIGERGAKAYDRIFKQKRMQRLEEAKAMHRKNVPRKQIWAMTGWELGIDGKWRTEIGYVKAKPNALKNIKKYVVGKYSGEVQAEYDPEVDINANVVAVVKPSEVLTGEALDLYPIDDVVTLYLLSDRRDSPAEIVIWKDKINMYLYNVDFAHMDTLSFTDIASLTHEIQHVIQLFEGFALGTAINKEEEGRYINPKYFKYWSESNQKLVRRYNEILLNEETREQVYEEVQRYENKYGERFIYGKPYTDLNEQEFPLIYELNTIHTQAILIEPLSPYLDPVVVYLSNAGEIEARNAEGRRFLTEEERRARSLEETEKNVRYYFPRNEQIIKYHHNDYFTIAEQGVLDVSEEGIREIWKNAKENSKKPIGQKSYQLKSTNKDKHVSGASSLSGVIMGTFNDIIREIKNRRLEKKLNLHDPAEREIYRQVTTNMPFFVDKVPQAKPIWLIFDRFFSRNINEETARLQQDLWGNAKQWRKLDDKTKEQILNAFNQYGQERYNEYLYNNSFNFLTWEDFVKEYGITGEGKEFVLGVLKPLFRESLDLIMEVDKYKIISDENNNPFLEECFNILNSDMSKELKQKALEKALDEAIVAMTNADQNAELYLENEYLRQKAKGKTVNRLQAMKNIWKIRELRERVADTLVQEKYNKIDGRVYLPTNRLGKKYYISAKKKASLVDKFYNKRDEVYFETSDSLEHLLEVKNELESKGFTDVKIGNYNTIEEAIIKNAITRDDLMDLVLASGINPNNKIIDALMTAISSKGFTKHFIPKIYAPGFTFTPENFEQTIYDYIHSVPLYKNKTIGREEYYKELSKLRQNKSIKPSEIRYLEWMYDKLNTEERAFTNVIRVVASLYYLAMTVAYLVQQIIQPIHTFLPMLNVFVKELNNLENTNKISKAEAMKFFVESVGEAIPYWIRKGFDKLSRMFLNKPLPDHLKGSDPEFYDILFKLERQGVAKPLRTLEITGANVNPQRYYSKNILKNIVKPFVALSALLNVPGLAVEDMTRVIGIRTLYLLGKKAGLKNNELEDFISYGIARTYSASSGKLNKPPAYYVRGNNVGANISQIVMDSYQTFKNYSYMNYGQWGQLYREAKDNKIYSGVAYKVAAQYGLGGFKYMMWVSSMTAFLSLLFDLFDIDKDPEEEYKNLFMYLNNIIDNLGDSFYVGVLSLATGADLSSLFAQTAPLEEPFAKDAGEIIIGVPYSVGKDIYKGKYPRAVRGVMQTVPEWEKEGVKFGNRTLIDKKQITEEEKQLRRHAFQPLRVSQAYESESFRQFKSSQFTDRIRDDIKDDIIPAIQNGDDKKAVQYLRNLYNEMKSENILTDNQIEKIENRMSSFISVVILPRLNSPEKDFIREWKNNRYRKPKNIETYRYKKFSPSYQK